MYMYVHMYAYMYACTAAARSLKGTSRLHVHVHVCMSRARCHLMRRSMSSTVRGRSSEYSAARCSLVCRLGLVTGAPISRSETITLGRSREGRAASTPERKAARKMRAAAATRSSSRTEMNSSRRTVG